MTFGRATVDVPSRLPRSEWSPEFIQGMLDRMQLSYYKYGRVHDSFPHRIDAIATCREAIRTYVEDGNTEHLIDAANYLMIEFMRPVREGANYRPTDSNESLGRVGE